MIYQNRKVKVGSDFSGVGAFDQSLFRLGIKYETVFACDMDKYARQTYIHNYGEPKYYPKNVYDREIPLDPLDIYMTSPPCQAFSLAGKRKGEDDDRGVLFYNSHEFIQKNKPRYFIFENVKGLLSSKSVITYQNSLYLLLYNFKQIKEWESLECQKNNLNLLSQSITNYLCLNYAKKLGLRTQASGMSYTTNSELGYEKLENLVKNGLKRRSKFLEERICQITKKSSFYHQELTAPLGCKEEDLVLNQNQSYLIENLIPMVTNLLEKTVGINASTSLFAKNTLVDNSKNGKWYTTLTELNLTIDSKIFMYVLELNIIRLITLALDLSQNLWKEIWLILTGKKEFIGLKTFDIWLFNLDHLNYHIYYQVLNAKHYGVPQNRERIFIVGIRDDEDNNFTFPKPFELEKRLKDVLETNVDEKYFLREEQISSLLVSKFEHSSRIHNVNNVSPTLTTMQGGGQEPKIKVKSATKQGYEIAQIGEDSINLEHPNSETRRGRVGDKVAQTLTTSCNQGVAIIDDIYNNRDERVYTEFSPTIRSERQGLKVAIGAIRGRNPDNPKSRKSGLPTEQMLEIDESGTSNCLTTVQKDNVVLEPIIHRIENYSKSNHNASSIVDNRGISPTVMENHGTVTAVNTFDYRIRKLTPRECFRLMDFPDSFTWPVSDSQAYKQAGNSIVVNVLAQIINKLDK